MCRESYPDIDQHNIDIDTVEKEWPKFHDQSGQTIAQELVTWEPSGSVGCRLLLGMLEQQSASRTAAMMDG